MSQLFTTDAEILAALRSEDPLRINAGLKHLYKDRKLWQAVSSQVIYLGGGEDEIQEIFQQALIIFFNAVTDGHYQPEKSAIATFITGIARKCFLGWQRSARRRDLRDATYAQQMTETGDPSGTEHQKVLLDRLLSALGDRCKQLLQLRSIGYSMANLSGMMGYKNSNAAKAAVHNCRKKLLTFLASRPDLLDELNDV